MKKVYQDPQYDCKLPTRLMGASSSDEVVIYELLIKNVSLAIDGFNVVKTPKESFSNNWLGFYEIENSSGRFVLKTYYWKYATNE